MTRMPNCIQTLPLAFVLLCSVPAHAQTASEWSDRAAAAYTAKQYAESAAFDRKAEQVAGDDLTRSNIDYNLACAEALDHHPDNAFATLDTLLTVGFTDRKQAEADPDLASLHADPRWPAFLARIDAAATQQDRRWGSAAFATPYQPNLTDAEKLAGLAELWAQAKYGFANFWHVPGLDWDKTYIDFIPQVTATQSTAAYYLVLQRFYALLQDGHSGVYPPEALYPGRAPLTTALIDGHVLVTGARDHGDPQGLQPGDEILSINDEPVIAYAAAHVLPYVSASTPQDRDSRVYTRELLLAPVGSKLNLAILASNGKRSNHTFIAADWKYAPGPLFAFRMLPGNIAYVALNGFDDDTAAKEWDKHWPEISQAQSLILDLRENGGGDDSVGAHILATLLNAPVATPLAKSTRWIASYRAWGQAQTPVVFPPSTLPPDPSHHFAGPVVLLASARTFSAGEDMVVVFATAHRGQILGEPTGGSTGQPLQFKLPGGGGARICTKHDTFPDGHEFVGIGVPPDLAMHNTRDDLAAGKDRVLETAIKFLHTPI